MKKTIRICLAVLLLAAVLLCGASCEFETASAYTVLRDHILESTGVGMALEFPSADSTIMTYVFVADMENADGEIEEKVYVTAQKAMNSSLFLRVDIGLSEDDASTADWTVSYITVAQTITIGESKLDIRGMTGNELIAFDTTGGIPPSYEYSFRAEATALTNVALLSFDKYSQETLSLSVEDFGFRSLSEKYRYTEGDDDIEADYGRAFSPERLKLAGTMLLVGMGMVFLALAIMWGVLVIFKKVMYDSANKKKDKAKPEGGKMPAVPAVPVTDTPDDAMIAAVAGVMAYQEDDGAIAAAITAAIAETIASDPELSREFADGFRVVSFKRKSGKSAWNK